MESNHSFNVAFTLTSVLVLAGLTRCSNNSQPMAPHVDGTSSMATSSRSASTSPSSTSSTRGSTNGAAGQMPAYYDGQLFTVNMKEEPAGASASTIANNRNLNEIFATNDLDDEQDFMPVISAIQEDGFNPLWLQILIVFNPGSTPHQFFSDDEVNAAASGAHPEITLVTTDEMYRCSVVGSK